MSSACVQCGACCANFRVSFYWSETDAHPSGSVPEHLTIPISPYHVAMRGTERQPPRCQALEGEIGQQVGCAIYLQRSSTCREFRAGDERCNQVRAKFGMPPTALEDADEVA